MDYPLAALWLRTGNHWKLVGYPRATHGLHMGYTWPTRELLVDYPWTTYLPMDNRLTTH